MSGQALTCAFVSRKTHALPLVPVFKVSTCCKARRASACPRLRHSTDLRPDSLFEQADRERAAWSHVIVRRSSEADGPEAGATIVIYYCHTGFGEDRDDLTYRAIAEVCDCDVNTVIYEGAKATCTHVRSRGMRGVTTRLPVPVWSVRRLLMIVRAKTPLLCSVSKGLPTA